jgi:hypothetical protein
MQTLRTILSNKVKRQYFHKQKPSKVNVWRKVNFRVHGEPMISIPK